MNRIPPNYKSLLNNKLALKNYFLKPFGLDVLLFLL